MLCRYACIAAHLRRSQKNLQTWLPPFTMQVPGTKPRFVRLASRPFFSLSRLTGPINSFTIFENNFFIFLYVVCVGVGGCRGQQMNLQAWLSPYSTWILGMEFRIRTVCALPTEPSCLPPWFSLTINFKADSVNKTVQPHCKHLKSHCLIGFPSILAFMAS